ncbi:MAG TPA: ChbG/HpnK family deacetylase, partial [Thermoanaerobaculia bacterium]
MKRLIVTADDFGMTDGVCAGIVEAMERGIVTQTSAMVCRAGDAERVRRWAPRVRGRLGVHLQITDGTPCLPPDRVRSLVDALGAFPRSRKELMHPDPMEVKEEWRAQWQRARQLGFEPAHFDSHHHVHMSFLLLPAIAAVARAAGAGARS